MKSRIYAVAVTALLGLATIARADGPIIIGVNNDGPLSVQANLSWVRTGVYWSQIQQNGPTDFNFLRAHEITNFARDNGQKVLFILSGSPMWCNGGDVNGGKPCNIAAWKTFVDRTSYELRGKVAAYEIWNEPDLINSSTYGVGWDAADLNTSPRYVDYLVEASRIIKANDPAALVVGPVVSGKRSGSADRTRQLFEQLQNTWTSDGRNASEFVDVISGHMNLDDQTHSGDAAVLYRSNVLNKIAFYNPRNRNKPMWITEFGWHSNLSISEDTQRRRSKNFLIEMTGGGEHWLRGWNFTNAFLYVLLVCDNGGDGEQRSIYRCNAPTHTPKLITSQYLQPLGFPAIQQPGVPTE